MANKTLTARVDFDTKSAEQKLKKLSNLINNINKVVNTKTGKSGIEKSTEKAILQQEKLKQATLKTQLAEEKLTAQKSRTALAAQRLKNATDQSVNSAKRLNTAFRNSTASANGLVTTVKRLAATYLGVMGTKAVITQSDNITSAENRLNALNGNDANLTQASLDKIYAASQRSRSGYGDMIGNVSKSMTLAGDAFQGNIDNAIRFQEIMSKAYTVGGASAAEQSSSMYQLMQALGSGILQGDELRSVREGAPLAYKAIEEFCQGVLDTDESLKDLASRGVITSDMVVAAIMDMENGVDNINDKFENTAMTFAQAWIMIKNTALKAFEPVLQKLNDILNSDLGKAIIDGICNGLILLAKTVEWVLGVLEKFFSWCVDNWEWLKYIVIGAITVIIALLAQMAWQAIVTAVQAAIGFVTMHWQLLLIVAAIMAILYVYELWRQGTITTVEAIIWVLLILATVALIVGIAMGAMWLIWVAFALAAIAKILANFAEFCGYVNVGIQFLVNAWFWLGNVVMGVWEWIKAVAYNAMVGIANIAMGLWNSLCAICENIGIAFENGWIHATNTFWSFIQSVLEGVRFLEPAINAIAQAFGAEGFTLSGVIDDVSSKQKETKAYTSVGDAWNSGMNTFAYKDLGEAWDKGYNTWDAFEDGWFNDAYDSGYSWGKDIEDKINEWGSQFQNQSGDENGIFTDLWELFGGNINELLNGLPDPNDPAYDVGGGYDPSGANDDINDALKKLGGIEDDTGKMADSMELTQEDLEYLRRVADMEWKKEFTTASITVDMSNYNTISGENDLDGIVEKLADKLYEEMNAVANGVYE